MAFCSKCGTKLVEGALYCGGCGARIAPAEPVRKENVRNEFYDGELHKCPNCKAVLSSGQAYCPFCHTEIRGAKAVSSVERLSEKLESINFDRTLSEDEKDRMIARTVKAFNIPNTKEDLLEFLDIAMEKKDPRNYGPTITKAEGEVISAWREKFRIAYQKAQGIISDRKEIKELKAKYSTEYNNNVDFEYEIEEDYNSYNNEKDTYQNENGDKKNKWVRFFLCLCFGYLGAHKFYDNKKGAGFLYLCTMGLFGFGWFIDIFRCLAQ